MAMTWSKVKTPLWFREQCEVTELGCWLWKNPLTSQGYGQVRYKGTTWLVHQAMYDLVKGLIPDGYDVCHTCDTRHCINPKHLFAGTRKENMEDMAAKLRSGMSKLTPDQVREIRKLKGTMPQRALAAKFGVRQYTIRAIFLGKTWSHVK